MKLNKYSWLAVLPLLITACQDDMLVEKHTQQGIYTLTATMDGGANSRAQIVLNGTSTTKESFHWNEEDAFTLFQLPVMENGAMIADKTAHQFIISDEYSDETPMSSADFSTTTAMTEGREFAAFYPKVENMEEYSNTVKLMVNNNLPDNSEGSWVNYFKKNMFMMARGTVANPASLKFEHLCGIVRITYKNTSSEDRSIKGLYVDGSWGCGVDYFLTNLDKVTDGGSVIGQYGLEFAQSATVAAGTSEDFYLLYMYNVQPEADQSPLSRVYVKLSDDNYISTPQYSQTLPIFEIGKSYWLNVTDDGNGLSWTNDQQGEDSGDSGDKDYTEKIVSTYAELKSALSTQTNQLVVLLKNNIALDAPLSVVSSTDLDLCGYTLSLSDTYNSKESTALFDVQARLGVHNGTITGRDGAKLHDYYFKLSGQYVNISLNGVALNTGTAISNAVFMDDDQIGLSSTWIWNQDRTSKTERRTSIVTSGDAIHHVSNNSSRRYISRLNGEITGNIYVESQYDGLNVELIFQNGTINGNLNTANVNSSIDISEYIRKADAVTIGSGYTGWDKAGRFVENQRYNVSTFAQLKSAIETAQVADESTEITLTDNITLESPLTLKKPVNIYGKYTLTMSDSFDWSSGADAAILVQGDNPDEDRLSFDNLILNGSQTVAAGKYLIKSSKSRLNLYNVSLNANGVANGIYFEDANMNVNEASSITVSTGGYALYLSANTRYTQAHIDITGTITGNVGFNANILNTKYPNVVVLQSGTMKGNFSTEGTYADDVVVHMEEGIVLNGTGWNEAAIAKTQKEFTENGGVYGECLSLMNDQVVTFTVGTTNEGVAHFYAEKVTGSGTVKFVNNGASTVIVDVNINHLDDGVKLKFEGNIRKRIQLHTTRIKEFFEMGTGSDQIALWLSSNVTLKEQIVMGSDRVWSEDDNMGDAVLIMDNHTLTIELDKPAFVVQGGMFAIDGGPNNAVGTIYTNSEFAQIGAGADTKNNMVEMNISEVVTINGGSKPWVSVKAVEENLSSHKNVHVRIQGKTYSDELKQKIEVSEGYTGSVMLNNTEINIVE